MTVTFSGHSDDIVQVTDARGSDEHGCYRSEGLVHAAFIVGGRIRVRAIYDGCWSFSVGQVTQGIDLPNWPIRFVQDEPDRNGYSVRLEIDAPAESSLAMKEDISRDE